MYIYNFILYLLPFFVHNFSRQFLFRKFVFIDAYVHIGDFILKLLIMYLSSLCIVDFLVLIICELNEIYKLATISCKQIIFK